MANFDRSERDNYERDRGDYDGGSDEEEDEGSHLPVVIIIAVIVLAAFGGVVWLAYNQGVARGRTDVPAKIAATQPVKSDDSGIKVYQQSAGPEEGGAAKPSAPPAAQPQAAPAQPPMQQAAPVSQPVAPAPAPAPKVVAPAAPPPKAVVQAAPPPATPPALKPVPVKPAPVKPVAEPPAAPQVATRPPAQLGGAHLAPATTTTAAAPVKPAPAPLKPATMKPVTEPAPAPAKTAAAAGGSYMLQIGAYKSEAEARTAWKTYQSKHAALLSGFGGDVQRTTHDDGSIWYRLRIASFPNKDAASAMCDHLKTQGGACFLSK